ncbi:MAG: hypothetical protein IJ697_06655 [Synergistaceae bacterium]|nr:hypothetical protein [Synergistaceae bacterium]
MINQKVTGLRYSKDNWFTCIDTVVLTDKYLSTNAKNVFFALCMLAGFGYRSCSPSTEQVADITCNSVNKVLWLYQELENRGLIVREGDTIHLIGYNAPCYNEDEEGA